MTDSLIKHIENYTSLNDKEISSFLNILTRLGGEHTLGLFGANDQVLVGFGVLARIDPVVDEELLGDPVDDRLVPVLAAQLALAVGRDDADLVAPRS